MCVWQGVCHLLIPADISRSSERLSENRPSVTSENMQMDSSSKRGPGAADGDYDNKEPNKRAKEGHKNTPHSKEYSGRGAAGSSKAKATRLSQKHLVKIQDGIHATGSSLATSTPPIQPVLFYSVSVRVQIPRAVQLTPGSVSQGVLFM